MPKKDFSQVAFDVVQRATGERPKQQQKPPKETAPKETEGAGKRAASKSRKAA